MGGSGSTRWGGHRRYRTERDSCPLRLSALLPLLRDWLERSASWDARINRRMVLGGDITSVATIPEATRAHAVLIARQSGVIAGLPLAVATSKPQPSAEALLAALGLRRWFRGVAGPSFEARAESKAETTGAIPEAMSAIPKKPAASMMDRSR